MVLVLVTRGKGASRPDYARIVEFDTIEAAEAYCKRINPTVPEKYWEMGTVMYDHQDFVSLVWPDAYD